MLYITLDRNNSITLTKQIYEFMRDSILDGTLPQDEKLPSTRELAKYLKKVIVEKGHYGSKLKSLVFCANIKEAKNVSEQLNNVGITSVSAVSGDQAQSQEQIEKYIEQLKEEK